MYSTIAIYFRWVAISVNHGQKCWHILSKTNTFYRRPSVISKSIFFVDSQPPSPPFQCCNTLRGHFHLATTLKRGEGVEMSKLDIENSLVERNGYFSESVSTTFVYDCSSASGQDDPNRALWLATRAVKMEPSCLLGTIRCIPQEKSPWKPHNKSFIDQVCSVKMVEYWRPSFFASLWPRLRLGP